MIITLNYLSGRLLIFISLMSFAGDLSCSLVWNVFLCLLILSDYLCLCICIRQNTYFSVLKECSRVGDDPWGPEAQSSLNTRARCSRGGPRVGCMHTPAVVGSQLLCGKGRALGCSPDLVAAWPLPGEGRTQCIRPAQVWRSCCAGWARPSPSWVVLWSGWSMPSGAIRLEGGCQKWHSPALHQQVRMRL